MATRPYIIDEMISAKAIAARVEALAREISEYFAGTDKLATVQKVVDLMGTKEFSKFLASSAGYTTRFPDAVPALYADEPPRYIPNIDLGWALAERDRILDEWMKRIGRVPQE